MSSQWDSFNYYTQHETLTTIVSWVSVLFFLTFFFFCASVYLLNTSLNLSWDFARCLPLPVEKLNYERGTDYICF